LFPNIEDVLEFFTKLYLEGKQYSSLCTTRSSLASIIHIEGFKTISDHPVISRFIKGVYHLRPPETVKSFIWDTHIVLNYFREKGENNLLTLQEITEKLVMLLILLHGQRVSTIATFDINRMCINENLCTFYPNILLKHERQGRARDSFTYRKYHESVLCPLRTINHYIEIRRELNLNHSMLLFTIRKPHTPPHKDTICNWIKSLFKKVGLDTNVFTPHSCRSSSTSTAKALKVPMDEILKKGCWTREATFRKFYEKELGYNNLSNGNEYAEALLSKT